MVAREQQEQAVADVVEGERATLPDAQDVRVEDGPADVVDLEVALEARLGGQPGRVDRLDRGEVRAVRRELGEDGLAAAVAEQVVVLVEAERGAEDRVVADEPHEAGLDEVVEVGRRAGPGQPPARGAGAARRVVARSSGCDLRRAGRCGARLIDGGGAAGPTVTAQAVARGGRLVPAPPSGSSRPGRARVATIAVSMSAAVTP